MLNTILTGEPSSHPPLLIVHGLFGSARNWGVIARRMSSDRQVITVDMRNHGASFRDPRHGYPEMAADLAEVIAAHGGRADVVGHSMGGKAAMMLALRHPGCIARLVVADIAPVAYGHSQRHLIEAMRGLDIERLASRGAADAALAGAISDRGTRAFLLQSLDLKSRRWLLNLDVLNAEMERITGWPAEDVSGESSDIPTLFLTGAESDYVLREHRPAIRALFPAARFVKIPGAGHWLHADRPRAFEETLRTWLNRDEAR
jgi:pimeloyl-ACP methyl ester carboxylesterase